MSVFQQPAKLKSIGKYYVYRLVLKDNRTPKLAKFLLWLALGLHLSPNGKGMTASGDPLDQTGNVEL